MRLSFGLGETHLGRIISNKASFNGLFNVHSSILLESAFFNAFLMSSRNVETLGGVSWSPSRYHHDYLELELSFASVIAERVAELIKHCPPVSLAPQLTCDLQVSLEVSLTHNCDCNRPYTNKVILNQWTVQMWKWEKCRCFTYLSLNSIFMSSF